MELQVQNRDQLIEHYFWQGNSNEEIKVNLLLKHNIHLSVRQIKRKLREKDLRRHFTPGNEHAIVDAIQKEVLCSGCCLGYRSMCLRLKMKYKLNCSREMVRRILKDLTPEAVEFRKHGRLKRRRYQSLGPNFCLHIDGYDKLKPWGFSIHGGICGFSRKICWLRVGSTNKDPSVVAGYFIDYIREVEGVPTRLRFDAGTENVTTQAIQIALRMDHSDKWAGLKSAYSGPSVRNQRIERFWGSYRQSQGQFWMTLFHDLEEGGAYEKGNMLHRQALFFTFVCLLQRDLDQAKDEWNQHRIRQTKHSLLPAGKPDMLFFCPERVGSKSYLLSVNMEDVSDVEAEYVKSENYFGVDPEYLDMFKEFMEEKGLQMPVDVETGLNLYAALVDGLVDGL